MGWGVGVGGGAAQASGGGAEGLLVVMMVMMGMLVCVRLSCEIVLHGGRFGRITKRPRYASASRGLPLASAGSVSDSGPRQLAQPPAAQRATRAPSNVMQRSLQRLKC